MIRPKMFTFCEYALEKLLKSPYHKHDLMQHNDIGQRDGNYVDYFECAGYEKFICTEIEKIDSEKNLCQERHNLVVKEVIKPEGWIRIDV